MWHQCKSATRINIVFVQIFVRSLLCRIYARKNSGCVCINIVLEKIANVIVKCIRRNRLQHFMLFSIMAAMFVIRGLEDDGWFPESGASSSSEAKQHIEQVVYIVSVVSIAQVELHQRKWDIKEFGEGILV